MAETNGKKQKKNSADIKRNAYVKQLVFGWVEEKYPEVLKTARAEATKKFPKSEKARKPVELPAALRALNVGKAS